MFSQVTERQRSYGVGGLALAHQAVQEAWCALLPGASLTGHWRIYCLHRLGAWRDIDIRHLPRRCERADVSISRACPGKTSSFKRTF